MRCRLPGLGCGWRGLLAHHQEQEWKNKHLSMINNPPLCASTKRTGLLVFRRTVPQATPDEPQKREWSDDHVIRSLLEIAVLASQGKLKIAVEEFLASLQGNPVLRLLPLTYDVALEIASLGSLRDPADRVIVATARVHRLTLVTSDQRIVESHLVRVVA